MTKRTALATAGALTIVLLAAAAAVVTNLGLLRPTDTAPVGQLTPADLAQAAAEQQRASGRPTGELGEEELWEWEEHADGGGWREEGGRAWELRNGWHGRHEEGRHDDD